MSDEPEMFQSLTGRLKTRVRRDAAFVRPKFQSLTGRLKTPTLDVAVVVDTRFQSLTGRLKTLAECAKALGVSERSFNPSQVG